MQRRHQTAQLGPGEGFWTARSDRGKRLGPAALARWGLALVVCLTVFYNADARLADTARQLFLGVVLLFNLGATYVATRRPTSFWNRVLPIGDVAIVTTAMWVLEGATSDFFLAYFGALMLAAFGGNVVSAAVYSLGVGAVYGGLLYLELGPTLMTSPQYGVRVGFVCAMGLLFAVLADEIRGFQAHAESMESKVQSVALHAKTLARDKYRLRALSEIGRLGLVGSSDSSGTELMDISRRVQKGVGVDRCSLVVFNSDGRTGFVAASSDDERVEVRTLSVDDYPELQATLAHGQVTQVHPNEPQRLWSMMCEFLPEANAFASFLVVPIKAGDSIFGAFYLRDRAPDRVFDEEEQDFCWAAAMMTASFIRGRDLLDQLTAQSRIDGLTGLLNFQAFTEETHAILQHPSIDQYAPLTVVVVDMDNLKPINDKHGHIAGNTAITTLGSRLQQALPNAVAMCRYGGDEFVALVHGSREDTVNKLEQMLNGLTTMEWDEPFDVRASIGVAEFPRDGRTTEDLLEAGDQAMYLAKGTGGHRIRLADADTSDDEIYDAVVQVQARRIAPNVAERFEANLGNLEKHAILGLQSPLVKQSIASLMEAVESLDPHSEKHSKQVAELCRSLAEELGLSTADALKIEIGGYLHDVGKIKMPPEILTKEGALSAQEREIVQQAPVEGARLLEALPGLRSIAELVWTYQERWDGSGYPRGLVGDDIPVGAQIIGICDVYQALISPRAQRPALDRPRARRLIEQEVGRLWSPAIAQAFLGMLTKREPASSNGRKSAPDAPRIRVAEG